MESIQLLGFSSLRIRDLPSGTTIGVGHDDESGDVWCRIEFPRTIGSDESWRILDRIDCPFWIAPDEGYSRDELDKRRRYDGSIPEKHRDWIQVSSNVFVYWSSDEKAGL